MCLYEPPTVVCFTIFLSPLSLPLPSQPSLVALALLVLEIHEEHNGDHVHKLLEAVQSLQQLLSVSDQGPLSVTGY